MLTSKVAEYYCQNKHYEPNITSQCQAALHTSVRRGAFVLHLTGGLCEQLFKQVYLINFIEHGWFHINPST